MCFETVNKGVKIVRFGYFGPCLDGMRLLIVSYPRLAVCGDRRMKRPRVDVSEAREGEEGRRQILLYLPKDLIKSLKLAAIEDGQPAYILAEKAIQAYLKTRKVKSRAAK
jgi:hypothetical protein